VDVPEAFVELTFLNGAVLIETQLSPEALLDAALAIEAEAGRVRTVRNGPRPLDVDLILYEGERRNTAQLTLPHPRAHLRDFVLDPLRDLGFSAKDVQENRFP
jgi:2-amino-4-hydroxy-6-hydroxymethyldihydropteridine diphosphokinase